MWLCWLGWKCVDSVHLCELIYMYCILLYCFCTLAYAFFFRDFFFFFSASPTQFLSFFALNLDLCACDTPRQNELKIADGSIHDWLTNSMLLLVCLLYKQIYFALQIIFCKRVVCVCVCVSIYFWMLLLPTNKYNIVFQFGWRRLFSYSIGNPFCFSSKIHSTYGYRFNDLLHCPFRKVQLVLAQRQFYFNTAIISSDWKEVYIILVIIYEAVAFRLKTCPFYRSESIRPFQWVSMKIRANT